MNIIKLNDTVEVYEDTIENLHRTMDRGEKGSLIENGQERRLKCGESINGDLVLWVEHNNLIQILSEDIKEATKWLELLGDSHWESVGRQRHGICIMRKIIAKLREKYQKQEEKINWIENIINIIDTPKVSSDWIEIFDHYDRQNNDYRLMFNIE